MNQVASECTVEGASGEEYVEMLRMISVIKRIFINLKKIEKFQNLEINQLMNRDGVRSVVNHLIEEEWNFEIISEFTNLFKYLNINEIILNRVIFYYII